MTLLLSITYFYYFNWDVSVVRTGSVKRREHVVKALAEYLHCRHVEIRETYLLQASILRIQILSNCIQHNVPTEWLREAKYTTGDRRDWYHLGTKLRCCFQALKHAALQQICLIVGTLVVDWTYCMDHIQTRKFASTCHTDLASWHRTMLLYIVVTLLLNSKSSLRTNSPCYSCAMH